MIGSVIFIRMNWIIKTLLNLILFIVYTIVVIGIRSCLFDNLDKNVFGICTSCDQFLETKVSSVVLLFILFCATVCLGRHVCILSCLLHAVSYLVQVDSNYRIEFLWKQKVCS